MCLFVSIFHKSEVGFPYDGKGSVIFRKKDRQLYIYFAFVRSFLYCACAGFQKKWDIFSFSGKFVVMIKKHISSVWILSSNLRVFDFVYITNILETYVFYHTVYLT